MPAGDFTVGAVGTLLKPGTETVHVQLVLTQGTVVTTLDEADLVFTSTVPTQDVHVTGTLHRDASTADCGDALSLHFTHPAGTQTLLLFVATLDLP